jgi:hypothetical protein
VREFRTLGSARGAVRKGGPYRDRRLLQIGAVLPALLHQQKSGHGQQRACALFRWRGRVR